MKLLNLRQWKENNSEELLQQRSVAKCVGAGEKNTPVVSHSWFGGLFFFSMKGAGEVCKLTWLLYRLKMSAATLSAPLIGIAEASTLALATARLLAVGAFCCVAAVCGFVVWLEADYFHHVGEYEHGWVGYDVRTFTGLVLFTLCSSGGVVLVHISLVAFSHQLPREKRGWSLVFVGIVYFLVACSGIVWGRETLKCLAVFCVNTTTYYEDPYARPEAGIGYLSVVGMTVFFAFSGLSLAVLGAAISEKENWVFINGATRSFYRALSSSLFCLFFLTVFGFSTFYVPNSWEYFVAARIAKNALLSVSFNSSQCKDQSIYTCPEFPWSWMKTRTVFVTSVLKLKAYPSNLCFFSYLFTLIGASWIMGASETVRKWKRRRSCFPTLCTNGELVYLVLTAVMLSVFFFYWLVDHNYNNYWNGGSEAGVSVTERTARALGQLAVMLFSICLYPVNRLSFLTAVLGGEWDASVRIHKLFGYGVLLATLGHVVAWYTFFYENGNFPHDVFSIPPRTDISRDNFTVPLITICTLIFVVSMGLFALEPFRRGFYEVFYYTHVFSFYIIVPAVLWHAAASWEYLLPGLTLWFFEHLIRLYNGAKKTTILSVLCFDNTVELSFQWKCEVIAAQHVYVCIPEISLLEWHPFTISWCVGGSAFVHIKSMGDKAWSNRALELGRRKGTAMIACVDGPYGGLRDVFSGYEKYVLVAGGIGVTPCTSLLSRCAGLQQKPEMSLLWCVREKDLAERFFVLFSESDFGFVTHDSTTGNRAPIRVFFTGEANSPPHTDGRRIDVLVGRPCLGEEIGCEVTQAVKTLIFVCGPPGLVQECESIARTTGADVIAEKYLL